MPRILAESIANALVNFGDEEETRHAALAALRLAASHDYAVTQELIVEVCGHLKSIAAAATDEQARQRILLAERIICSAADEYRDLPPS